ncbi:ABC transporter permease [Deinococcus radiophilus]|uniref:Iron ABC transporter permease n=1 Tax=Deinococcus radiophilus TaxID=32062 RepID=A0A431W5J8_9DEIO|nr:iron ABC transporter permease [Deinococcus radiophilus]RTR30729.1 iron ABC transporter permease [Deinococcus radiophilus]UFA51283.1 iron ABC transporter permease [Deinococcus radiophilus]
MTRSSAAGLLPSSLTGWLVALPSLVFLTLMLVLPLGRTLTEGGLQLGVWGQDYFQGRLAWTLWQAGLTAGLALLVGVPLAYLLSRYRLPGGDTLLRLLLLPFVTPVLVAALGLNALLGPRGWLSDWLPFSPSDGPLLILLGNLFFNLPVMIRLSYGGFSRISPSLIGAARTLGAGGWGAALRVGLPLALPGIAAGAILTFLYSALSFGLPLILGGARYATLEVEIYTLTAYQLRLGEASALIAGQLLLTLVATWVYVGLTAQGSGTPTRVRPRATGGPLWLGLALTAVVFTLCFVPLLAVVARSLLGSAGPTLAYWQAVLSDPATLHFVGNTVRFGLLALIGATLLGGLHALGAWLARARTLDLLSLLPLMVSPVSLAVGYLLAYPRLAATLPMLLAAYTLLAYPLVTRSVLPALRALPPRTLEAAHTLGAGSLAAHRTVTLPLTLPALRGGAALSLATVLGEFGATLVLTRPEWATLSVGLYQRLGRPGDTNLGEACALATILLLLAAGTFWLLDGGKGEVT